MFSIGDIVYIYCSLPLQRITHKCIVEKIDIESDYSNEDDKYVVLERPCNSHKSIRLKLINTINKEITLNDIGIQRCQGPRTITDYQASIIDKRIV